MSPQQPVSKGILQFTIRKSLRTWIIHNPLKGCLRCFLNVLVSLIYHVKSQELDDIPLVSSLSAIPELLLKILGGLLKLYQRILNLLADKK